MEKLSVKILLILSTALLCVFLLAGCYTKLMTYQGEVMPGREGGDCADCAEQVPANHARREVCVWERDIFGYPEMRCYNTNYHSSWMYFHSTPWWYRNSFGWYDTRGCPPNYYYDRFSGICRLYGHRYPSANDGTGNAGGGGGTAVNREPDQRRNMRGTFPSASEESAPSESTLPGGGMFGTGAVMRPLSPVGAPVTPLPAPPVSSEPGQTLTKPQEESSSAPERPRHDTQQQRPQRDENQDSSPRRRNMRGM
jgi:hypothetical protein